ncbi:hypothetical protein EDC01DRAFT_755136 [Geopyxis carbonaria]|nr:hypothetical protein EDC01DRAFT_755136 [Geopyxis carbonaria]
MPGFADSFWSGDYAGGLGVLFGKLQQGIVENQQVLQIAKLRADAEDLYGAKLMAIPAGADRAGGFGRDDGASVRKAFDGMKKEMDEAGKNHKKVADNIRQLVIEPFAKWCEAHEDRVLASHDELQSRIKSYDKQHEAVKKLRSHYFNKCRLVEDMDEETKFIGVPPPDTPSSATTPAAPGVPATPQIKLPDNDDDEELDPVEIGDEYMQASEVKKMLGKMLDMIPQTQVKVAILGTYQNVSTGEQIVEYIMKQQGATSVSYAERVGQDLVSNGFLRLIGAVGSTFANSSKMNYQWRPKAFQWAAIKPKATDKLQRAPTIHMNGDQVSETSSPTMAYVGDYLGGLLNNQRPGETPGDRLRREASEADEKYKGGVRKLDLMRCDFEEAMMDNLKFMERCELDRLKAIKSVILDFAGAISNVIPSIQATVDTMMLYQETVQPLGDLRYLLESYRTGSYVPKVITYESYYNSPDEQTFGVDLEARARADRKRVPVIITSILTYLDHHYPDLDGDEARRGIWLVDVPLAATHHLRNAINNGKAPPKDVLAKYEVPIVASVLKLYLLELPDSIVSSHKYEIIKTVYTTHGSEGDDRARLAVIQNTLGSLPLTNIATLDAITTHFTRLIELTSADEAFVAALAHILTYCILRPRFESSLTASERHSYRLVRDLFAHKEQIFGELKRASAQGGNRMRAISTDESQRRTHMEARNRAVISAAKSRSSSPAPPQHRKGGSGDVTRFPINVSPTSVSGSPRSSGKFKQRESLEVPSTSSSLDRETKIDPDIGPETESPVSESASPPMSATAPAHNPDGLEKSNSLSRTGRATGGRFPRKNANLVRSAAAGKRDSIASNASDGSIGAEQELSYRRSVEGVTLSDRPMDD